MRKLGRRCKQYICETVKKKTKKKTILQFDSIILTVNRKVYLHKSNVGLIHKCVSLDYFNYVVSEIPAFKIVKKK